MILTFINLRKVPLKAQASPSITISNGFLKMFMNGKALYIPLFKVSIMPCFDYAICFDSKFSFPSPVVWLFRSWWHKWSVPLMTKCSEHDY